MTPRSLRYRIDDFLLGYKYKDGICIRVTEFERDFQAEFRGQGKRLACEVRFRSIDRSVGMVIFDQIFSDSDEGPEPEAIDHYLKALKEGFDFYREFKLL